MRTRRTVLLAFFGLSLLASFLSAAASFPVCDKGAVCIFFGFNPEKVAQGPSGTTFTTSRFSCPVSAPITGAYGLEYANANHEKRLRTGIEMAVTQGTDVRAPADGYVVDAGYDALQLGNFVIIRHGSNPNVETKIGFLQTVNVRPDDKDKNGQKIRITKGQIIGKAGNTGAATGPSVYFELDRSGIPQREVEDICKGVPAQVTPANPTTAGVYEVSSRSQFQASTVQLAGIDGCVQKTKAACPQQGTASFGGRTWAKADPICIYKATSGIYHVPYSLLRADLMQESGGQQFAVSPGVGASGYAQLMPGTAAGMGIGAGNLFDPYYNICGGVEYLSRQLKTFGSVECALAAYNAGPGAVRGTNPTTCVPPYAETQNYVKSITAAWDRYIRSA